MTEAFFPKFFDLVSQNFGDAIKVIVESIVLVLLLGLSEYHLFQIVNSVIHVLHLLRNIFAHRHLLGLILHFPQVINLILNPIYFDVSFFKV